MSCTGSLCLVVLVVLVGLVGFLLEGTCVVVSDFGMEKGGFLYFFFLVVKSNDSKYLQ
jgi:hypothetical protein